MVEEKKRRMLITNEEIIERIKELGSELDEVYKDKKPLAIAVLRGGFIFAADLVRAMDSIMEIDFLTTASYGHAQKSSGRVEIVHDVRASVEGRDVLLIDDIIDSGHTLKRVKEHLLESGAKSVNICVMLDKPSRREVDVAPDYVAFEIPDVFIVGFGLNYGDYYRNVPYIYTYDD